MPIPDKSKKFVDICNRLDTIRQRDGPTDRNSKSKSRCQDAGTINTIRLLFRSVLANWGGGAGSPSPPPPGSTLNSRITLHYTTSNYVSLPSEQSAVTRTPQLPHTYSLTFSSTRLQGICLYQKNSICRLLGARMHDAWMGRGSRQLLQAVTTNYPATLDAVFPRRGVEHAP